LLLLTPHANACELILFAVDIVHPNVNAGLPLTNIGITVIPGCVCLNPLGDCGCTTAGALILWMAAQPQRAKVKHNAMLRFMVVIRV
jgi:hypothetical protein